VTLCDIRLGFWVSGHAFCFVLSVFLLFTSSSARLFSLGPLCSCFWRELLDIPRLLGALMVAQVAGLVFFGLGFSRINRTRGFYFPSAVALINMPGGFLVSSCGVWAKGFFFAGCFLLWWFLDLSFERHSEAN
jgi:hypothetical protein